MSDKKETKEEEQVKVHFKGPGEWRSQTKKLEEEDKQAESE